MRVEHSIYGHQTARMRVVYYAVSTSDTPKQVSDDKSECAVWFSIEEIRNLNLTKPGLRSAEVLEWPMYIESGAYISPLEFFTNEDSPIEYSNLKLENCLCDERNLKLDKYTIINAIEDSNIDILKDLLTNKIDINEKINSNNWTPLHYAIKKKNEEIVKILILYGANPGNITIKQRNCFHFAMQSTFKILKMILLAICDLDYDIQKEILNTQDLYGNTPLHILAKDTIKYKSDLSMFEFMIGLGSNPNIKNYEGFSAYDIINK